MNPATTPNPTTNSPALCLSFELGVSEWKMAFSTALGQRPWLRTIPARDLARVEKEIEGAKEHFGVPAAARVASCYEAGRDGFWLHRALLAKGIENHVVDSASIEVNRRARRAKTDRLDAGKLLDLLWRWLIGEKRCWHVVRAPGPEEEDRRQLHRELMTTRRDRTRLTNRIKGLLFAQGIYLKEIRELPTKLGQMKLWDGSPLPQRLRERIEREWEKVEMLSAQIRQLKKQRRALLREATDEGTECARKLLRLGGIGANASWLFALEFFSWRDFQNGKQIGALAGLAPTPHQSGDLHREQGITKAGNRWVRALAIEIAWAWLRYQPQSELSQWYERKFGHGSARVRKIGIVALARKLLIELWRYLQTGTPPAGARLKEGTLKV